MENKKSLQKIFVYLGLFLVVEIFSFFALSYSNFNSVVFVFLVLACFGFTLYKLEYGLLFVLAELFIGSMGHLLILPIEGFSISIRVALWLVVLLVYVIKFVDQLIKDGKSGLYLQSILNLSTKKYFLIFAFFIVIGLLNAYWRGHELSLIFGDFNAWLYWLLLFPSLAVYNNQNKSLTTRKNLENIFLAAVIWLSFKTLFLLFVFTHNLIIAPDIYLWLRKTLVGEMTPTLSGWPRVFIQGQIFSGVALFLVFFSSLKNQKNYWPFILATLFLSTLLISFSRSFWVGIIAALLFSLGLIWRLSSWRKIFIPGLWFIFSMFAGFLLIYLVAIFPYPNPGKFNADFLNRVSSSGEAAIASRWSLWPVLMKEIIKEPFLGQGYGATITYFSRDPRILEKNQSGEYTTYAFEWGYLDLWLKVGLFGLLAYLLLISKILKEALLYGLKENKYFLLGLVASIIFLLVTNFFTPYLNHPLGIGILVLGACLISKDGVYFKANNLQSLK